MGLSPLLGSPDVARGYRQVRPRRHPRPARTPQAARTARVVRAAPTARAARAAKAAQAAQEADAHAREPAVAAVRGWHARGWGIVAAALLVVVVTPFALPPDGIGAVLVVVAVPVLAVGVPVLVARTALCATVGPDWLLVGRVSRRTWVDLSRLRTVSMPTPADDPTVTLTDRAGRTVSVDVRLLLASQPVRDVLAAGLERSLRDGLSRGDVVTSLSATLAQPLAGVAEVRLLSEPQPRGRRSRPAVTTQKHRRRPRRGSRR